MSARCEMRTTRSDDLVFVDGVDHPVLAPPGRPEAVEFHAVDGARQHAGAVGTVTRHRRRRCTTTTWSGISQSKSRNARGSPTNTEHSTAQSKVYCCAIKDLFSNRIVGSALNQRMTSQQAVSALRAVVARRPPDGVVIVHADRGSISGTELPDRPDRWRDAGLHGPDRGRRGQRSHGVILGAAEEERP